jgi:hypothetical protein
MSYGFKIEYRSRFLEKESFTEKGLVSVLEACRVKNLLVRRRLAK